MPRPQQAQASKLSLFSLSYDYFADYFAVCRMQAHAQRPSAPDAPPPARTSSVYYTKNRRENPLEIHSCRAERKTGKFGTARLMPCGRQNGTSRTGRTIRTPPPFCIFCTVKPANGRSISPAPGKSRTRRMCNLRKKPQIKFSDHFPNCTKIAYSNRFLYVMKIFFEIKKIMRKIGVDWDYIYNRGALQDGRSKPTFDFRIDVRPARLNVNQILK